MKCSLICTVKNEVKSLDKFLDSVINQTKRPDELIIVDGGSTDGTIELIKKYSKKHKWIKLFIVPEANISKGRNYAVTKAENEIILSSDGGCVLNKDWVEKMLEKFENCDVVVGNYKISYKNNFEKFQGLIVKRNPSTKASRASSRSLGFRKKAWKAVGGYPENTYTGEDTLFNLKLKEKGFKFCFAKDAIVYWEMRSSWKKFFKQFYKYGFGDSTSKNIFRMKINLAFVIFSVLYFSALIYFLINSVLIFYYLLIPIGLFLSYQGLKYSIKGKSVLGFYYAPLFVFLMRFGYVLGVLHGLFSFYKK